MTPRIGILMWVVLTLSAAANAQTVSGISGNAVLSVSSGLAPVGSVNPLAMMPLMLIKQSFADVLQKNGTSIEAWSNACRMGLPACKDALAKLEPVFVDAKAMDPAARVAFGSVPPGTYFVFAQAFPGGQHFIWDVKIDLKAGPNAIVLDQRNMMGSGSGQGRTQTAAASNAPNASASAAAQRTDPSIAKAHAAKVDTMVFGIPLGEPLQLRECESLQDFAVGPTAAPPSTCLNTLTAALLDLGTSILPFNTARENKGNEAMILLGKDSCPIWMATCQATATLSQGLLVGVTLVTKGPSLDALTAKELRAKYGAPTFTRLGTVTPDTGKEFTTNNLEWVLPGLHVEYEVVSKVEVESSRVRTNEGAVRIETETAYQLRQKETKELTKRKL